jgi:exopolysaccharide biosynthesis polyprenyl glycosylphosphotransferase
LSLLSPQSQDGTGKVVLTLDCLALVLAMGLSFGSHSYLRGVFPWLKLPPPPSEYILALVLALPIWLGVILWMGLHQVIERPRDRIAAVVDLLKVQVLGFLAFTVVAFCTQSVVNRSLVALFLGWGFLLLFLEREILRAWARHLYARGLERRRLLLVGADGPEMAHFVKNMGAKAFAPEIVGRLGDGGGAVQTLGSPLQLEQILRDHAVDWVLFFPPFSSAPQAEKQVRICAEVGVPAGFPVIQKLEEVPPPRVTHLFDVPLVAYASPPPPSLPLALKHGLDALLAGVLLILLAPLLLLAALAILITMGRPLFFIQRRTGHFGREFGVVKFRTMVLGAEAERESLLKDNEMDGPVFKITKDPRVTRLGAFLRRTSIDELPQLWNVLVGEMSLVGPRPLPVQEQRDIQGWQRRRLTMRPGITGLWQVSGRNEIDFDGWMQLDLKYVNEWSPGLDLWILLRTIPAVLGGRGAS